MPIGGIYRIDAETGEMSLIVQGSADMAVSPTAAVFSRDGTAIFYRRYDIGERRSSLLARDLETGREEELAELAHLSPATQALSVSPDGRWLAWLASGEVRGDIVTWTALRVVPIPRPT